MSYRFFLGCYTQQNTSSEAMPAKGIYTIEISEEGKLIGEPRLVAKQVSPTYFYLTKNKKTLYAVSEPGEGARGLIVAYHVAEDGSLTAFSKQVSARGGLCHVMMDQEEKNLIVIAYHDATIESYPIDEEGKITPMFCLRHHIGSGPVIDRQEAAHTHSINFTPDYRYAVVCDLGIDQLRVYTLITETGKLHRAPGKNVICPPGSGPRHMVFSPDGRFAYVACELNSEVLTLSYDPQMGLKLLDRTSTLSPDFSSSRNYPAAIRITKDGRHLYVSNRGEDTIALFDVDNESGKIMHRKSFSTLGWYPRDFILSEDERYLIAVNQLSDNIAIYARDENGELTLTDEKTIVQKPIALMEF